AGHCHLDAVPAVDRRAVIVHVPVPRVGLNLHLTGGAGGSQVDGLRGVPGTGDIRLVVVDVVHRRDVFMARRCRPTRVGHDPDVPAHHPAAGRSVVAVQLRRHRHDLVRRRDGGTVWRRSWLIVLGAIVVPFNGRVEGNLLARGLAVRCGCLGDGNEHGQAEYGRPASGQEAAHQAGAGWLAVGDSSSALMTRRCVAEPFGWQVVRVSQWPGVWATTLKSLASTTNGGWVTL